jgi:hypothetical protein
LRPKEIQARIRAGETVEEIADAAGIAIERVRWFEGPVLAERAYVAQQAQAASVRRLGDGAPATPGPRLSEIVAERLKAVGSDPEEAQWDAKKRGDGSWLVQLTFISGGRLHEADWIFDPRRRHVLPADDNAARMSLPGGEPPQPAAPPPGEATVTQLAPRLSTAVGQGFGQPGAGASAFSPAGPGSLGNGSLGNGSPGNGNAGNGRPRHERPGSVRPAVPENAPAAPSTTAASAAPGAPAASVRESGEDVPRVPVSGRNSIPTASPQETETQGPAVPVTSAPSSPAPATAAAIAAQVTRAAQASRPGQRPQSAQRPQPTPRSQEPRKPQPRPEPARPEAGWSEAPVQAVRRETRVPEPTAPAAAATGETQAPEPASEQAARQSRKAARGKRASVPSWDEIMFGNTRQRD